MIETKKKIIERNNIKDDICLRVETSNRLSDLVSAKQKYKKGSYTKEDLFLKYMALFSNALIYRVFSGKEINLKTEKDFVSLCIGFNDSIANRKNYALVLPYAFAIGECLGFSQNKIKKTYMVLEGGNYENI